MKEKDYNQLVGRRQTLKTLGAAGIAATVGVGTFTSTAVAIDDNPNDSWTHRIEISLLSEQKGYHSSTVSWYGSEYLDSRDTWIHDVSLGTVGTSQ